MNRFCPCLLLFSLLFLLLPSCLPAIVGDRHAPAGAHDARLDEARGHRAKRSEVLAHAARVACELHGIFPADAEIARDGDGIHVRAEEDELPAVLFLLMLDELLDLLRRVANA